MSSLRFVNKGLPDGVGTVARDAVLEPEFASPPEKRVLTMKGKHIPQSLSEYYVLRLGSI